MRQQNYQKDFLGLKPAEPPAGLFDRIILAIEREQKQRHSKKLLTGFFFLFLISLISTPLSGIILINQIKSSGISYFLSAALSDLETFLALWQDFSIAIIESLPTGSVIIFLFSLSLSFFTLRLFLHKKRLLLAYLRHNFT